MDEKRHSLTYEVVSCEPNDTVSIRGASIDISLEDSKSKFTLQIPTHSYRCFENAYEVVEEIIQTGKNRLYYVRDQAEKLYVAKI